MAKRKPKEVKVETPAQRLSGIIKSCRNIMRKDKGMNGDGDRLPMLTWLMFLKFLDDNEMLQETQASLKNMRYEPAIEKPYRWRDWARETNLTGDDLLSFVNNEKVKLLDGEERIGLLYYFRGLQSETGTERKDVIATVFRGVTNRMINGYLLRDVINKIDEIHFTNNEEVNTLSHLYESLLREMRDASGDAGEFYTPRPVVKFMVDMLNPQIGETVLDPASGTGGFLVESFELLKKQAKTVEQQAILQNSSIIGGEAKPLPYLLCQMNLLLHGLNYPNIDPLNSLRFPLREISDNERVDLILTNPPFGGEEEKGILNNFPEDKRTAETALLFLQLIMRKLQRRRPSKKGGRAAVVVPNGTLFADGISGRIKKQLLEEYNLHTVVRLGEGVFAPYTNIPSNLLFFEHGTSTKDVWYYEVTPPEGRKKYTKTKPIRNEEFSDIRKWWNDRRENENAWKVELDAILHTDGENNVTYVNLDLKNPHRKSEVEHREPMELASSIIQKETEVMNLLTDLRSQINAFRTMSNNFEKIRLGDVITHRSEFIEIDDFEVYKLCRVQTKARGVVLREEKEGLDIKTKKQQVCRNGDLIFAEMDARFGGYGLIPPELDGAIVSSHYFLYEINSDAIDERYLEFCLSQPWFLSQVEAQGSTNYAAIRPFQVLEYEIPLPSIGQQQCFAELLLKVYSLTQIHMQTGHELTQLMPALFDERLKGKLSNEIQKQKTRRAFH